ncbi:hypothetical protein [Metabacillus halosaccharovorans]|uniref:hypothetical protein n=1 Tax=Metabacillus halosaccharovorans TaxID=930124 RepID=UPI002040F73A|nr:hypothetical protein [Metabacillus halosaccharovorans]MCM3442670.1 hypothetical protein [Metabacillus halosaccharovorans]
MSIEILRTEVKRLCQVEIKYIALEDAPRYHLSVESPANVRNGNEVYVIDCIPEEEKLQAEAHELGHIFIREMGLISFQPKGSEPFDFLLLELNNALSHRFVIEILSSRFYISNAFHLKLRTESLESIVQDINDFKEEVELLHAFGLRLYDIYKMIADLKNEVERLAGINDGVNASFSAAKTYLEPLQPETPKKEQESAINSYLNYLGYNKDMNDIFM